MSGRRIELNGIQVVASVLAAVTGAIVASSLGVAGTMIGVAVVSFATTAGTAIYRHYLARTQERLRSAAAAMGHLGTATAGQTRPAHWGAHTEPMSEPAREPGATAASRRGRRMAPGLSGEQIPSSRRYGAPSPPRPAGGPVSDGPVGGGLVPGGEAAGGGPYGAPASGGQRGGQPGGGQPGGGQPGSPVHETWVIPVQVAARLRAEAEGPGVAWHDGAPDGGGPGEDHGDGQTPARQKLAAVIDWARTERWPKFAAVAIMVFVLAMGGITVLEAATGKPLDALIWGARNSGTTVGNVVSGPAHRSHHPSPATPSSTPTPHPTASHHRTATPTPSPHTSTPTPRATPPSPTPTPTARTPSPSATPTPAASHSPTARATP
jgi:hypothetical protein